MGKKIKGVKIVGYVAYDVLTPVAIGAQPDKGAAEFFGATKTHFGILQRYNDIDVRFDIYGKGFGYQFAEVPTSGKIKKVEIRLNDDLALIVSRLNLDALDAVRQWQKQDPFSSLGKLLKGNDIIIGSPFHDPSLWGGKGDDSLFGRGGNDTLDGWKGNDLNDGGAGNDLLKDTKGSNVFQFSTPFLEGNANLNYNYDTITKLKPVDRVYFSYDYFGAAGMKVSKGELAFSAEAQDSNDFFLFFANVFSYDPDGNGPTPATPIFNTLNDAKLTHKMIQIGLLDY
jgi:hypothetical protein